MDIRGEEDVPPDGPLNVGQAEEPGPSGDHTSENDDFVEKAANEVLVNADDDDQWNEGDICRVCRFPGDENPLFHPCLCTGSIKYVHQHCLLEWLKYSKKNVCELCNHKFIFRPVYREDMPDRLPMFELAYGLLGIVKRYVRLILTYMLATVCWLGVVPLIACRVHRMVFEGSLLNSFSSLYTFNFHSVNSLFSTEELMVDVIRGMAIVAIFLCTFILLVFLREQIVNGGPPELFNLDPVTEQVVDVLDQPLVAVPQDQMDNFVLEPFALNNEAVNADPADNPAPVPAADVDADGNEAVEEDGNVEDGEMWGRDVDRIVDDLTWQRLLGLDGSLIFIEHVIWMISLNVLFIITCLFFPCKLGEFTLYLLNVQIKGMYFEAAINFFIGYINLICGIAVAHRLVRVLRIKDAYWFLGFLFLILKVSLLIALEVIVFPSFCGWWLDICSLPLTGATLGVRLKTLSAYPISSVFVHWLVGMIDVFYSASFVLVLRELLRPGVLWFVRDLNDPEFQPIQEMIEQGFLRHFRRLVASTTLFFGIIFVAVFVPLKLVTTLFSSVLPYSFSLASEMPLGEFSFELILLQVVLPSILEQSVAAQFLKAFVIQWCIIVGGWLGLGEYLLPRDVLLRNAVNDQQPNANVAEEPEIAVDDDASSATDSGDDSDDDDVHVAVLDNPAQPPAVQNNNNDADNFVKPSYFGLRILLLLTLLSLTIITMSFAIFVLPVTMGRQIVYLMLSSKNPNDLYTISLGLYIVWLSVKAWIVARMWLQQGWGVFCSAAVFLGRVLVASLPLVIIIPYLIGAYFQLLVVGPLRVASHQTPLYFPFKDWAMGLVHFKLFCASVFVGPDWWLKTIFERLYEDGVRNYKFGMLYMQVVIPIICFISFLICFPYAVGWGVSKALGFGYEGQLTTIRYMYPGLVSIFLIVLFIAWQWSKMKKLANKIRNDKYLIGTQLVNFYREGQLKFKQG